MMRRCREGSPAPFFPGMSVDLLTLYKLIVGTLLASAGMTWWESRANAGRARVLRLLAAGFATLALGCGLALVRLRLPGVPGVVGSAVANLFVLSGYLLVLHGIAALSQRRYFVASAVVLLGTAAAWFWVGESMRELMWTYWSSVPIAFVNGLTAWEMWRSDAMRASRTRYIVIALSVAHTLVYATRAYVLPWLTVVYGSSLLGIASSITIYLGVLYSILLPMTLLRMIRDETHGKLLHEVQTDYLTRLGNRKWFFEQGTRAMSVGPVSVLAFDLDQFKSINDRYGHHGGDEVLKSFAQVLREVVGPGTVVARIGGEEFAAVLVGDDAWQAQTLAEEVGGRFTQTMASRTDHLRMPATVSIGVAQCEPNAPTLAGALAAADRALYRAKSLGGNRLELA